jgi:hypothetical protein
MYASGGSDVRLWDPDTAITSLMPLPGYNVFCSGHAFLADGRLFIAGGHIADDVGVPNASIYDAVSNTWTAAPNMNAGRWYPTATTLANGDVLVLSGEIDTTVGINPLPQVFQAASGTWHDLTSAQLYVDLYPRMHLAPNGQVFNSAPSQTTRYLDTSGTGAWTVGPTRTSGYTDYGSSVMYDDGKVLVMGGDDPPTSAAEMIDLNAATPSWRLVGSMAFARRHLNATLLPDGKVLVTGGTSGPGFNNTATPVFAAEMWDPATERWTTMASTQAPRLYHSAALLLPDGRVLTTGGDNITQVELYSPPYLFAGARPSITSAPAAVSFGQSYFVETPDAANIAKVTWIRLGSVTHAFNMNQRINSLSFSQAPGGLNVVSPSNPNLAPPGHYLLFILTANGVPSIAKIVQLGSSALPDVIVTSLSYGGGVFTSTVKNQGTAATPAGTDIGVAYFVDGVYRTWGGVSGPLAAGAFVTIGTNGGAYTIANGTHTITAFVDDVNRFAESDETNNKLSQPITVGAPDTQAPAVSVTAPANGATVSGSSVTVSANASDNVGVSGVQFKLDGTTNLGAEDTLSPYSVAWNSATAINGLHTLTAVARDAAGNTTTSAEVSVTVNNTGPALPDVIVTSLSYGGGVFTSTVKNQGTAATPAGTDIGVAYFVDGVYRTWGSVSGPLAAGAFVTIGTNGGAYTIPNGTHTITAFVDDVNRFAESDETNNKLSQPITIP